MTWGGQLGASRFHCPPHVIFGSTPIRILTANGR